MSPPWALCLPFQTVLLVGLAGTEGRGLSSLVRPDRALWVCPAAALRCRGQPGPSVHHSLGGSPPQGHRGTHYTSATFCVLEPIRKKVAGGGHPPKRLRGDFQSPSQVLLKPLARKGSVPFLRVPPNLCPTASDVTKSRVSSGSVGVLPGKGLVMPCHSVPGVELSPQKEVRWAVVLRITKDHS